MHHLISSLKFSPLSYFPLRVCMISSSNKQTHIYFVVVDDIEADPSLLLMLLFLQERESTLLSIHETSDPSQLILFLSGYEPFSGIWSLPPSLSPSLSWGRIGILTRETVASSVDPFRRQIFVPRISCGLHFLLEFSSFFSSEVSLSSSWCSVFCLTLKTMCIWCT